jgi:hypothetical protein
MLQPTHLLLVESSSCSCYHALPVLAHLRLLTRHVLQSRLRTGRTIYFTRFSLSQTTNNLLMCGDLALVTSTDAIPNLTPLK